MRATSTALNVIRDFQHPDKNSWNFRGGKIQYNTLRLTAASENDTNISENDFVSILTVSDTSQRPKEDRSTLRM
jgi:hypothetical protein